MSTESPDDAVAAALDRVNRRLDAIEAKLDALPGPQLPARLADPAVAAGLDRLLDRLDAIEGAVTMLGHFSAKAPVLADAAGETARYAWEQLEGRGIDPIAQGQAGLELLARLADPEVMAIAERALANLEPVRAALDALDAVDPADLKTVASRAAALTGTLAALLQTPELARLLEAGPGAVGVAEHATLALVASGDATVAPVGPLGALLALRDPDVGRAVGFGIAVARRFGQRIS